MHKKDFDEWNNIKKKVNKNEKIKLFEERQIWWVFLGENIGFEQNGKRENFSRPVLIIRKYNKNMALILPMTSKNRENNKFYYKINYHENDYSVILSQARIISNKRLIRKIWKVPESEFKKIKNIFKNNFI